MSTKSLEVVNIQEQRRCLDKLDEEIEKTLTELDSLNSYTLSQAKKVQKKAPVNKFQTPNRSSSQTAQPSPNAALAESACPKNPNSAIKIINQEGLQTAADNLVAKENTLKETGYSSVQTNGLAAEKENLVQPEDDSAQKKSALPANFWLTITEKRKQKSQGTDKKDGSMLADSRENTLGSYGTQGTLTHNTSQKSIQKMMEYHKLSNLDIPKEIIHGNSKPEHFFGFQQNLRKQISNQQQRSPRSTQVVDRLLQYGRDKDDKHKALMEGKEIDIKKKIPYAKPPTSKGKLSGSFIMRDEQNYVYEEEDSEATNTISNDNVGELVHASQTNFSKKGSIQLSDGVSSQVNQQQGGTVQYDSRSLTVKFKGQSDPVERKGESININRRSSIEELEKSQTPGNITLSSAGKYPNIESRYMSDLSKSPQRKAESEVKKLSFRPQLSRKSLEIAAKLGDSFQRLVDTSLNKATENKKKLLKEVDSNLTFKPKINKYSEQLDEQYKANIFNGDDLHRWDQLYLMKDKYKIEKELKKLERERIEKENDECTFQPKLNEISSRLFRDQTVCFADRASAWKEMKERKLKREKSAILEKELEECTFEPATNGSPARLMTSRSAVNLNEMSMCVKGLDSHFEKIDRANKMKREIEHRQEKFSGKNWKRQITVPREFQLTKRSGSMSPYSRNYSVANLDISTEEKICKNVLFLDNGRNASPQAFRTRDNTCNDSMISKNLDHSVAYENFSGTIVRLHHELQRMEI